MYFDTPVIFVNLLFIINYRLQKLRQTEVVSMVTVSLWPRMHSPPFVPITAHIQKFPHKVTKCPPYRLREHGTPEEIWW
jgi:hypothetical protein